MPVIVFNKQTGKYLRRHSGSYRHAWRMLRYQKKHKAEILKRFGEMPAYVYRDDTKYRAYIQKVNQYVVEHLFNAEPSDARVYTNEGGAISSIGERTTWVATENRDKSLKVYELPDHLEIHEIKESFVCVMRPDGSSNCDDEES